MTHFKTLARKYVLDTIGFISKPSTSVHILAGHRLINQSGGIDVFKNNLSYLSKAFTLCSLEDALMAIDTKKPLNKPLLAFTFDDGLSDLYSICNVLEDFGCTATLFINPGFTFGDTIYINDFSENKIYTPGAQPLSFEKLKELSDRGFNIGAHTYDHEDLSKLKPTDYHKQIFSCKETIEFKFNKACNYFAWPYGTYEHINQSALDACCSVYDRVFSSDNYRMYYGHSNKIINRRHFEPDWPLNHIKFFLSKSRLHG
jgi:peptidoglycan/xylan/chitin deacetylase (PgdA/CDA1 family)